MLVTALSFGRYSPEPAAVLAAAGCEVRLNRLGRPMTEAELAAAVADVDAVIVGVDPVTAAVLAAGARLKVVAKHGVGVDNIDVEAARGRGVVVANAPGSNDQSVADLAFGLLLAAARQIPQAHAAVIGGGWQRFQGPEVWQKTLGIIGLGRIGRGMARRAGGFAMRVLAYDPYLPAEAAQAAGAELVDLDTLLSGSDFVTLHMPGLRTGAPLLDRAALERMKPGAILVNTARGSLVDEAALVDLLQSGHLGGAGLDVYTQEPPPADSPLLRAPRLVLTPHLGAYTPESNRNMGVTAAENVVRVLRGELPLFGV